MYHSRHRRTISGFCFPSPDFAYDKPVEQEAQGEEDHSLDEGGDEHPAQGIRGERVLIGVNAVATEQLDLYVHPGQLHQPVPKVELREDQEGVAQTVEEIMDDLQRGREGKKRVRREDISDPNAHPEL